MHTLLAFLIQALVLSASAEERLALLRLFPSLEQKVPRMAILSGPTPVRALPALEKELLIDSGKLWVKMDDGSPSDPLGGNKARKLEFLLGAAKAEKAHTLITAGMYGSNHALATAVAAKRFGFKAKLILGPQPVTKDVKEKLLAFHALGAELRFHSGKIGMGIDLLKAQFAGKGSYYIPPGGSSVEGDLGYVNAFLELAEQLGPEQMPERIVVPVGSMGTAAGLLVGSCLAGMFEKVRIEGVGVADPLLTNDIALRKHAHRLHNYIRDTLSEPERKRLPRCGYISSDVALQFIDEYYDPGYGEATAEVHQAIALLKKTERIKTEATYSGKALAYLIADLRTSVVKDRKIPRTLFWLTYHNYDLKQIIREHRWKNPTKPWLELPEGFHSIFTTGRPGS